MSSEHFGALYMNGPFQRHIKHSKSKGKAKITAVNLDSSVRTLRISTAWSTLKSTGCS